MCIMEKTIALLKNYLQNLYPISDSDFEKISTHLFKKEFKPRERLIIQNQVEENLYFISAGVARKFFYRNKQEVITQFYAEGELVSEIVSFLTGQPSSYVIEAIEPVVCLGIQKAVLENLLLEMPVLEKLYRTVLADLYVEKEQKDYNNAWQTKQERFMRFCEENASLIHRIPQKFLASFLEIAPETFCRMKHLRYKSSKKEVLSEQTA